MFIRAPRSRRTSKKPVPNGQRMHSERTERGKTHLPRVWTAFDSVRPFRTRLNAFGTAQNDKSNAFGTTPSERVFYPFALTWGMR